MGQSFSCFRGSSAALVNDGHDTTSKQQKQPAHAADCATTNNSSTFVDQVPKHIGVFEDLTTTNSSKDVDQPAGKQQILPHASASAPVGRSIDLQPPTPQQKPTSNNNIVSNNQSNKSDLGFDPHKTQDEALGHPAQPNLPHNPHEHGPPRPPCEDERLQAADQVTKYLDAAPKKELENILQLVCNIFKVDNALIALFGDRRIYIINTVGGFKAGDFPWRWSFCGWTMASEQHTVMVINDALQDARFADNKYVQEIGVRFYCGAPLVSSTGHRLGTLCFADTQPRIFDTSSLQILANFSELVTRELEKDIALAKQQQQQAEAAAADRQQQYELLLRTVDCVTSAVLVVDTSKPHWPILHANSGWERLQQQCQNGQQLLLPSLLGSSSMSSSSSGMGRHVGYLSTDASSSSGSSTEVEKQPINCCFADVLTPLSELPKNCNTTAPAAAAAAAGGALASDPGSSSGKIPADTAASSSIIGLSLWSLVDPHLLQQISGSTAASSSSSSFGSGDNLEKGVIPDVHYTPGDQVVQQVRGRQSFTLRGVKLAPALGGAAAQFTFRCAGFSVLEGAASICLPAFCPDASEVTAAAAALTAKNPNHTTVSPTVAPGDSLYFVTIKLHQCAGSSSSSSKSSSAAAVSSTGSSLWTQAHAVPGMSNQSLGSINPSCGLPALGESLLPARNAAAAAGSSSSTGMMLTPCMFPQFGNASVDGALCKDDQQQQQQQGLVVEPLSAAAGSSVRTPPGLVVFASVSNTPNNSTLPGSSSDSFSSSRTGSGALGANAYGDSSSSSLCAGLVCSRIAGLTLGGQIAAGSYGRVYRGDFFGTKVAVKVLDGHAVLHRDEATGFSLEALLSEQLRHPNVIRTLAWAVVTGEGKLPAKKQLWGETLDPEKPSVAQIRQAVNNHKQQPAAAAAAVGDLNSSLLKLQDCAYGSNGSSMSCATGSVSNSGSGRSNNNITAEDLECDIDDVAAGQTWMVMEYADRGCLQDAVERGWLRERPSCVTGGLNLVAVLATAAEIASGMALLHDQEIVHGDLSAFNVMLSSADPAASVGGRGFVAKVADFGLARTLTHTSKIITKTYGTITHMAPEVLEQGLVSKAADVYSFGVLLWQMVTGSRAWAGMSHMAVVNAVCCQKLQLKFPQDAPEGLVILGQACMTYDAADRPTFREVLEILEPLNELLMGRVTMTATTGSGVATTAAAAAAAGGKQQQKGMHGVETL